MFKYSYYLASEAKKNSTALSPTAWRQVELSSLFIRELHMFFTFSMLPIKEMRHFKCKTRSVQVRDYRLYSFKVSQLHKCFGGMGLLHELRIQ